MIVMVEDEALIAMDLSMRLASAGYDVDHIFATGEEIVSFAKDRKPDLVLMDSRLAGPMDGVEAMRRLRHTHPDLPIIFITGYAGQAFIDQAAGLDPVACLTKPVNFHLLLEHIQSVLPVAR